MSQNDSVISCPVALFHGFRRRCPHCGEGKLFKGYLTPQEKCLICDLNFEDLKADDGPAYITMGLVCLLIVPFFFIMEALYEPPLGIALLISLPLTLLIILGLLPLIKGAFMAAIWKSGSKNE
jgi:uncharacterized protein (DUF983 family)